MTYIRTSKSPADKRNRIIALAVAAVVAIIVLIQILAPYFLPAIFTSVARPFWRMEFSVENGSLDSPQALLAENEALKNEITALQAGDQSIDMLQSDNLTLFRAARQAHRFSARYLYQAALSPPFWPGRHSLRMTN